MIACLRCQLIDNGNPALWAADPRPGARTRPRCTGASCTCLEASSCRPTRWASRRRSACTGSCSCTGRPCSPVSQRDRHHLHLHICWRRRLVPLQESVQHGTPERQSVVYCLEARRRAQENFKHYRDLWRLDLERHAWELLPGKGGPAGRSGHRMALHKNKLVVFGGFNDSGKACQCVPWQPDVLPDPGIDMSFRRLMQAHSPDQHCREVVDPVPSRRYMLLSCRAGHAGPVSGAERMRAHRAGTSMTCGSMTSRSCAGAACRRAPQRGPARAAARRWLSQVGSGLSKGFRVVWHR